MLRFKKRVDNAYLNECAGEEVQNNHAKVGPSFAFHHALIYAYLPMWFV